MRDFDPIRLAGHEADAWVAYYHRRWLSFLRSAVGMIRVGFGMSWPRTVRGAWLVLRANQAWAPYPDNDPDHARALMRRFYADVARRYGQRFDVDEAARLEVEWWRIHRHLQREAPGDGVAPLTDALAALYAHLYGVPEPAVRDAAAHRAAAMRISDEWVADGRDPRSPAIAAERNELIKGYALLRAAMAERSHQPTRSPAGRNAGARRRAPGRDRPGASR
jgi:hypothetical protein